MFQSNVQQSFQQLSMILLENYTEEDRAIIAAPSADQVSVILIATFSRSSLFNPDLQKQRVDLNINTIKWLLKNIAPASNNNTQTIAFERK